MKFVFLAGGFVGFISAAATGWSSDHSPQRTLLDAAVGCLVGALLFRWFWTVLVGGIRETILIRHAAAAGAATAAKSKQK
jgi:hypothetical protein